jgi:hypothetical protein
VTASKELSKYKLDLVQVQEVEEYTFFYRKGNENRELGTGFLCIRESYQQLISSLLQLLLQRLQNIVLLEYILVSKTMIALLKKAMF